MPDESLNKIEKLENTLYSKNKKVRSLERTELTSRYSGEDVKRSWTPEINTMETKNGGSSFLVKLLIFAIIFFITTLGVAGYVFFKGTNSISGRNIDLTLKGPVAVEAGDETNIQVVIANRNTVDLLEVKLLVEFPDNTKENITDSEPTLRQTDDLGTITSGEVINKSIKAVYFGQEKEEKHIKAKIEYKIPGSNSLYTKNTDISFIINSPPISLNLKTLPEVVAGQSVTLDINISANTNEELVNTLVRADYPEGFTFKSASPAPDFGDNVWSFKSLENNDIKNIKIVGIVDGQNEEVKTFKFSAGLVDPISEDQIGFTYNQITETLALKKPFLNISTSVNNDNSLSPIVEGDSIVRVEISWVNNLDVIVDDLEISAFLEGDVIDKTNVFALNGFYKSSQNTITWTKNSLAGLKSIKPGEKGNLSFSFRTKALTDEDIKDLKQPSVDLNVSMVGNRNSAGFSGEKIFSNLEKNIKVKTKVELISRAVYKSGDIQNTGSLPPKVGEETTYTLIWSLTNSSNDIKDTIIKTTLPPYINWKNVILPSTEKIAFNPSSRELVWNVGKVPAGGNKQISFQLGLIPDLSQLNQSPRLIDETSLATFDTFTETVIKDSIRAVDTKITSDTNYSGSEARVIQ